MRKKELKQWELDKIYRELIQISIPVEPNKKREPMYRIIVDVTEKEYRALKRKLKSMR